LRERLRIGEVAGLVGVTTKTVRYFEKIGRLQRPERSESGYRLYAADELLEVHRIKRLRSLPAAHKGSPRWIRVREGSALRGRIGEHSSPKPPALA
jgi:hypothetical protein